MKRLSVREYLRVSRDIHDTGRSPDQQHGENKTSIEAQGWALHSAAPYRDADRSASRYARKEREDFKRLIGDLESGTFDADVLAIWESSRGSRRVGEWVDLVDLCRERSVRIWVTTHNRLYDPANARDRRSLLEDAVDAEYESEKTSERRRRSSSASAEQGRPHGRNLYGYRRVYDEQTRELVRVEEHPDQAPIVKEAAMRIMRHDSIYSVAREFNRRGVPPRCPRQHPLDGTGGWNPAAIKAMLRQPAYVGKRVLRGNVVADAIWGPLIDPESWEELQAILCQSDRKRPRDHTAKHLLSTIARCGVCNAPLKCWTNHYTPRKPLSDGSPAPRRGYLNYACGRLPGLAAPDEPRGFHVSISVQTLDEIVCELLFARLSSADFTSGTANQGKQAQTERRRLIDEIAAYEDYLDSVRADAAALQRFDLIIDQESRLQPLIRDCREALAEMSAIDPYVREFIDRGEPDVQWKELDLADQRRIVRAVLTPRVHRLERAKRGRRELNEQRVEPVWR
ncbi:recombinase family protein [Microbacterium sp. kSW2-24]|uniref:recombinase family protein n=1 Tax=Microbacterium galbinum TaxID=2851646 RepID=UPI001FFD6D9B|nr:recombinase family protein [Microbacterium galbinum]MCK2024354.1 recombinase family protein [Microbacterium galbinum]